MWIRWIRIQNTGSNTNFLPSYSCPHGPTLLFQDTRGGSNSSSGDNTRQFYACSAYRSKKFCDFHLNKGDKITPGKLFKWAEARRAFMKDKDHVKLYKELTSFLTSGAQGHFCQTCCRLLLRKDPLLGSHAG
jgi:hypothetical protein